MPRVSIRELLSRDPAEPILMDGGTGGSLEERGVDVRNDLWSSAALLTREGRDTTRRLHEDFLASGADIVIANVHNVCPETCASYLETAEHATIQPESSHPCQQTQPTEPHVSRVGDVSKSATSTSTVPSV